LAFKKGVKLGDFLDMNFVYQAIVPILKNDKIVGYTSFIKDITLQKILEDSNQESI